MSYQSKTNWQLDDIVMPDDMNRIEQGISNLDINIDTKATTASYTATIPTTGWTTSAPYYVDIAVSGILSTDVPSVSPVYSGTLETDQTIKENWNKTDRVVTSTDSIRVYAFEEVPTASVPIQLKVVR